MTDKLRQAVLVSILVEIEQEGEDEVAWFNEELTTKELVRNFLCDPEKRFYRLPLLVCTFRDISAIMAICDSHWTSDEVPRLEGSVSVHSGESY